MSHKSHVEPGRRSLTRLGGKMSQSHSERIQNGFNSYQGPNTEVLDELYDVEVTFTDPLIHLKGLSKLKKYYQRAYAPTEQVHFEFHEIYESGGLTYTCEWTMHLTASSLNKGQAFEVRGVSVITFSPTSDKVIRHHDYLDIGDMVYERLPILGRAIRLIKKRLA